MSRISTSAPQVGAKAPAKAKPPKTYHISFVEVIVHSATIEATSEEAAIKEARIDWRELGNEAFRQETLGASELFNAKELNPSPSSKKGGSQ